MEGSIDATFYQNTNNDRDHKSGITIWSFWRGQHDLTDHRNGKDA